jgi:hypothetical protein
MNQPSGNHPRPTRVPPIWDPLWDHTWGPALGDPHRWTHIWETLCGTHTWGLNPGVSASGPTLGSPCVHRLSGKPLGGTFLPGLSLVNITSVPNFAEQYFGAPLGNTPWRTPLGPPLCQSNLVVTPLLTPLEDNSGNPCCTGPANLLGHGLWDPLGGPLDGRAC